MRGRFWQNVTLIALAHFALIVALLRWAGETKAANTPEITWLSGGAVEESPETNDAAEPAVGESTPEPNETAPMTKSEIVLPSPSPVSTPRPTPQPTPKKSITRPTAAPKPTPKKKTTPKTDTNEKKATTKRKETATKTASVAKNKTEAGAKKSNGGTGDGASGTGSGKSDAATATYYGNMLHDRFYRAWSQPQTVVASGAKLSAIARIRVEKDGHVSSFKIVKPSGNVLVDESVQSAGGKVTQVDALPAGMGNGGHYDVNINFALNSQ